MKTYGILLVGCGYMGAVHLENLHKHNRVRIIGVADLQSDKAQEFARKYGAEAWDTDYRNLLMREDVDIVIIATYPSTHLSIAKACIEAGKHILCEKPIAGNIQDAEEFIKMASSARTKVMVGHILRHNTTYKRVAEMIRGDAIGSPIVMRMSQVKQTRNWETHLALLKDASPIVDCGVHYVDVMRWVTGADVESVSGVGQRLAQDVPENTYNYGMITMKFTDGSIGYYEAGWGHSMPNDNLKEFIGPKGRIRIIYKDQRPKHEQHLGNLIQFEHYPSSTREDINIDYTLKPTGAQFDHFIGMIEGSWVGSPTLEEVYRALQVTILADRAIHEGKTFMCM
jgi:predicted dehydrogenase